MKSYYALFIFSAFLTLAGCVTSSNKWHIISLPDTEEGRDKVNECHVLHNPGSSVDGILQYFGCLSTFEGYDIRISTYDVTRGADAGNYDAWNMASGNRQGCRPTQMNYTITFHVATPTRPAGKDVYFTIFCPPAQPETVSP